MNSILKKRLAIRCITEKSKGYGNLGRCISLADEMREKRYDIVFIINKSNFALKELEKRRFQYVLIPNHLSYKKESDFIIDIISSMKCDGIIVDMREYGEKISKNLMRIKPKVILIDDAWCKKAYADLVVNVTMIKKYHKYEKINKNAILLLGSKYYILNKEFVKHKKKVSEICKKKIYKIAISMGGADPDKLTLFVLKSLLNFFNIKIRIILGPFFETSKELFDIIRNKKNITLVPSPKKIWKEFQMADVVISNSGNTLFELAVLRVPTICIAASDHQIPYAKEFAGKGSAINLGLWKSVNNEMIQNTLIQILDDVKKRKKMCLAATNIVDGNGLLRVTKSIEKCLKN